MFGKMINVTTVRLGGIYYVFALLLLLYVSAIVIHGYLFLKLLLHT